MDYYEKVCFFTRGKGELEGAYFSSFALGWASSRLDLFSSELGTF